MHTHTHTVETCSKCFNKKQQSKLIKPNIKGAAGHSIIFFTANSAQHKNIHKKHFLQHDFYIHTFLMTINKAHHKHTTDIQTEH